MNVILIGYRGTGKSTIGMALAKKTGRAYVSTDETIVRKSGMSVPEIVEKHGWTYFRDLESIVAEEVSHLSNSVIDTGGGIVLRERNVNHLRQGGKFVWLSAKLEAVARRIQFDTNRPPLARGMSFLEEQKSIMEERMSCYKSIADFIVDTSEEAVDACVDRIIAFMAPLQ